MKQLKLVMPLPSHDFDPTEVALTWKILLDAGHAIHFATHDGQRDARGLHKPVAAVCHGVLLAARSISPQTGKSVLYGRRTTALTWDLERSAWQLSKYWVRFWDANYYRTYSERPGDPVGYWSVEQEVKRDRLHNPNAAWVVQDGNYVSARWPGDVHTFALRFVQVLKQHYR